MNRSVGRGEVEVLAVCMEEKKCMGPGGLHGRECMGPGSLYGTAEAHGRGLHGVFQGA